MSTLVEKENPIKWFSFFQCDFCWKLWECTLLKYIYIYIFKKWILKKWEKKCSTFFTVKLTLSGDFHILTSWQELVDKNGFAHLFFFLIMQMVQLMIQWALWFHYYYGVFFSFFKIMPTRLLCHILCLEKSMAACFQPPSLALRRRSTHQPQTQTEHFFGAKLNYVLQSHTFAMPHGCG